MFYRNNQKQKKTYFMSVKTTQFLFIKTYKHEKKENQALKSGRGKGES